MTMKIKDLKRINNILFYSSVIFALGVLGKNYWDRSRLPEGVCPIDNNSYLIYISISLLIVSFIFSIVLSHLEKKQVDLMEDKTENDSEDNNQMKS